MLCCDILTVVTRLDVSHIAPLLEPGASLDSLPSPILRRSPAVSERVASASPRGPSPASPAPRSPTPLPEPQQEPEDTEAPEEVEEAQPADDVMDVDEAQDTDISGELEEVERPSPVREEVVPNVSPSPEPDVVAKQPSPPAPEPEPPAELSQLPDEARQSKSPDRASRTPTPAMEVVEPSPEAVHAVDLSRSENDSEDTIMGILRTASRTEVPLPIARIESQTKYLVAEMPSPAPPLPDYTFDVGMSPAEPAEEQKPTIKPAATLKLTRDVQYNLPALKSLPVEYNRKGKVKQSKKRDKDKGEGKSEWQPLGFAKWGAMLRVNPVHKKVAKAEKCLSTPDWNAS